MLCCCLPLLRSTARMCAQAGVSEDRTADSDRELQDKWARQDAASHVCRHPFSCFLFCKCDRQPVPDPAEA